MKIGVYSRNTPGFAECGLWLNTVAGGTVTGCMFTPHASGRFYGGKAQTLGGMINQFEVYGANPVQPGPSVRVGTVRVESDSSGDVIVRGVEGDTSQFAGRYVQV